jgi:hypothetical protein
MEKTNTAYKNAAPPISDESVIVSLGAEGGGVELLGRRRAEGSWEFRRVTNDSSWAMLDEEMDPNPPVFVPTWVSTWNEAITLLDRYPWARLHPLVVHKDFRSDVLVEVTRRLLGTPGTRSDEQMAQWLAVCKDDPDVTDA